MGRPWTTKLLVDTEHFEVWTENDWDAWWVFKGNGKKGSLDFEKGVNGFWYYSPKEATYSDAWTLREIAHCLDLMNKEMDEAYAACVGVMFDEDGEDAAQHRQSNQSPTEAF